jgi:hypothetical protein
LVELIGLRLRGGRIHPAANAAGILLGFL